MIQKNIIKKSEQAFTLVEIMIVISMMMVMLSFVYLPYAHYQEKIKVRQVVRESSQTILEARNLAINGFDGEVTGSVPTEYENKSIGVYFDALNGNENHVALYAFSHTLSGATVDLSQGDLINGEKRRLPTGAEFTEVNGLGHKNILFYFDAISGFGSYYHINGSNNEKILDNKIRLDFSYKGSDSPVLQSYFDYDTRVNIVDYGLGYER